MSREQPTADKSLFERLLRAMAGGKTTDKKKPKAEKPPKRKRTAKVG
jgi:hypothetical protein